jgi:hypothetical protein
MANTYPYGTQNAPSVGNGLGGLPRRTAAAAASAATANGVTAAEQFTLATASGSVLFRSFTTSTTSENVNDGNNVSYTTPLSDGSFIVPWYYSDQVNYHFNFVRVINTNGVLSIGADVEQGYVNQARSINPDSCFDYGGFLYVPFDYSGNFVKWQLSNMQVSTVASGFALPTSGTISTGTLAGQTYGGVALCYCMKRSVLKPHVLNLKDGTALVFATASVIGTSNQRSIVAFKINTAGTVVSTFVCGSAGATNATPTITATFVKQRGTTTVYDIYAIGAYPTATGVASACSTFDISSGIYTVNASTMQSYSGYLGYFFVRKASNNCYAVMYNSSGGEYRINEFLSGVDGYPSNGLAGTTLSTPTSSPNFAMGNFDSDYDDIWNPSGGSGWDSSNLSLNAYQNIYSQSGINPFVQKRYFAAVTDPSIGSVSYVSGYKNTAFIKYQTDSSATQGDGVRTVIGRISENSFLVWRWDSYSGNTQRQAFFEIMKV